MPDFGSPVAQSVQVPSLTGTLGGLMSLKVQQQNLQLGQQRLQVGENQAQAAQQTQQERARITQMMQTGVDDQGNSVRGQNGEPDPAKILPALGRMAPLTGQAVAQSILQTQNAKVGLQTAATSLDSQQRAALMGPLQAVAANPTDPEVMGKVGPVLDSWAVAHPEMAGVVNSVKTNLLPHILNAPTPQQRAHLANSMAALLQGGQAVQTQPAGASVSDGQTTQIGATAPPVAGGGFQPSTSVQQQPPPTTQVVEPSTGQSALYGARPPLTAGSPPVSTGVPIGTAEGITGPVATNNAHYASVQQAADGAQTRIGILQEIKSLAPQAMTGDAPALKKIVSKLAGYTGWTGSEQTPTDVMAKESAMLAAKSGNTDLARLLGEAATPNGHMTQHAIQITADQLVGQEKAKLAAQKFFSGTPTNSPLYAEKLKLWSQNGDPQAFEYASKSPAEQAVMKAAMQKAGTWAALRQHMLQMHNMGIEP